MLVIQVRLLAGRYVATEFDDRDRAEWPPHPARLFAAAVAAWADAEEPDPAERSALTWWESLGAPTITCSPPEQTATRSVVTHYVPVNDLRGGVLSRDPSEAYGELGEALDAWVAAGENPDEKGAARAQRRADAAAQKAQRKAAAYTRGGRAPELALEVFPENRVRQARTYPSTTPDDDVVTFCWPDISPDLDKVALLDGVLSRIGRLGHSSTPVDVAVVPDVSQGPLFEPGEPAEIAVRTTDVGQLDALVEAYEQHQGTDLRTLPAVSTGYRRHRTRVPMAHSNFEDDSWMVFDLDPRRSIRDALLLTRGLRNALMSHADQPPSPMISGHHISTDGAPTEQLASDHAAYVALPYVGSRYADGSIHALAIVVPREISDTDRRAVVRAVGRWQERSARLVFGSRGEFVLRRLEPEEASVTARPDTWSQPATRWSSATPLALDRHPGALNSAQPAKRERAYAEAEQSVIRACHNIGLPTPASINIRSDAPIRGTRPVRDFRPLVVGNGLRRMLVHVDLTFDRKVRGPVMLGAGRFFGYGLCWPLPEGSR